jgi:hypothetical protein
VSWELALRHCAALRATLTQTRVSLELQDSQLIALEAFAKQQYARETAPKARIARPTTCEAYKPDDCARLDPEAAHDVGGMSGETKLMCRGCGLDPRP